MPGTPTVDASLDTARTFGVKAEDRSYVVTQRAVSGAAPAAASLRELAAEVIKARADWLRRQLQPH